MRTVQLQPQVVGVQAQEEASLPFAALAGAAITENCKLERSLPQEGQQTDSPLRRTSFSKARAHSSQTYSKIGIRQFCHGGAETQS